MISLPLPKLTRGRIPAEDGRRFVRFIRYWRPMEIGTDDDAGYRHPFEVLARWDTGDKRWEIQHYQNSMVGPLDVEAPPLTWDAAPRETRFRFGGKAPGGKVTPWLSEEPWLPVEDFRAVGTDASPFAAGEEIPETLLDLGVAEASRADTSGGTISLPESGTPADRARRRLARAVDIVLHVERERVRLEADDEGGVQVTLDLPTRELPWISVQPQRFEPTPAPDSIQAQIAAAVGDPGIDSLVVARLYLVSAAGSAPGAPVDETWIPIVDQKLYWNVEHATNRDINTFEKVALPGLPALAGGFGNSQIDAITKEIEQNDAAASAFLSEARVVGRFWTV